MSVRKRWEGKLRHRKDRLAYARRQAAYWRARRRKARKGTAAYSRAGAMLAAREATVRHWKRQVAYAERVVKRHSATRLPASARKLSDAGLKAIAGFEGLHLRAYRASPGEKYLTIGYGHCGPDVRPGQRITKARALELLRDDLYWAERAVRQAVDVPLSEGEYDALVSLAFNIGAGAFSGSTLVRKLNAGDRRGAANEFLRWDKQGTLTLLGLSRRRRAERARFLS